jgi:RluA family pseudouridine synthase
MVHPTESATNGGPIAVDILYEQGPCVVVYKPAGVLTQAPPGIDSMEHRVKEFLKHRDGKTGNTYLGVPHRLDRPVSGAMVFARHVRATRRLAEQFEGRLITKRYWACLEGTPPDVKGTWRDFLRKVPGEPRAEVVAKDHPEGREAVLHFRHLGTTSLGGWLEIELETGRTHQIRIQAASRGWPIVGDTQYGATIAFGPVTDDPRERTIALHARELGFRHPMTQEAVQVVAEPPAVWEILDRAVAD